MNSKTLVYVEPRRLLNFRKVFRLPLLILFQTSCIDTGLCLWRFSESSLNTGHPDNTDTIAYPIINTSIHIFIPCHRKNSQSECKKAAVYSKVLHPPSHCALRVLSVFGKSKKKSESACQNMNTTTFSKMTSPNVIRDCSIWAVRIPNFGPSDCSGIASEFSFSSLDQFAKHVVSKKIQWYFLQQR